MPELGKRIRDARINKGMSQAEVAREMGLKQASISQFENGQRVPMPANIRKLAGILGVEETILAGKDEGQFERAMLMRNIQGLSPESLQKINELTEIIKQNEQRKRRD